MEGDLGWHYGGDGSNNWNLDAIVRLGSGGRDALAPPRPLGDDPFFELMMQQQQDVLPHADEWQQQAMNMPAMADPAAAGLDDFLSQAFAAPQLPQAQPSPPRNEAPPPPQQEPPAVDRADPSRGGGSSQPRRTRNNMEIKTVMTVPVADFASSDVWAWRKYGQKPIKGSAYPRGYYRCSSDKDCPARKQSERCINDPTSLVVTYTGEHNHAFPRVRNALAGTLRHRREASSSRARTEVGGSSQAPPPVSPPAPPRTVSQEFNAEEDDDAIAVKVLIDNAAMGPENAYLFPNPDDVPFHGGGEDNLLLPAPERMAVGASHGTVTGAGGGGEPILNVVMDTLFVSGWETAAGRRGNW